MDYLKALNPRQQEAVQTVDGPLLIIAGAGSGKTRVLTYRMAYLISECQVKPYNILAVTFTNKAAQEMKERIKQLIGAVGDQLWVSTFHSTCVQILRADADKIGLQRSFLIFDTADQQMVIRDCMKELNLDSKQFEVRALLGSISNAKNQLLTPELYKKQAADFWTTTVARVYEKYQNKLVENNALDFDDLIMYTVYLFNERPDVLGKYQQRFQYIMVDEYQDTNHSQYTLVNLLAQKHQNLCVVGDDDQSIYAFRGADIRNIIDFEKDYPQAKVIKLEQNYRSTQNILKAANHVISNNTQRKGKELFTQNPEGDLLFFYQAEDERQEANFIAETIREGLAEGKHTYQDYTILYRTHAQSRIIEEIFMQRAIPYRIVSGLRFYDRKEIKDLTAYLRLIANPYDNYSFRRIINEPKRGLGDVTISRVESYAESQGISLFQALDSLAEIPNLTGKYQKELANFKNLIDDLRQSSESLSITDLVDKVLIDSGYLQALRSQKTVEAEVREENLKEFKTVTWQFDQEEQADLNTFLEKISLMSDVDNYDQDANVVTMMTLHAAKGLEFPVVFLVGMEDGVFPSSRSLWEPGQIEEERRLAYVGITRAEEQLYLTCARRRTLFGQVSQNPVSTFVKEIPAELIEEVEKPTSIYSQMSFASMPKPIQKSGLAANFDRPRSLGANLEFKVGDRVRHAQWGEGMIVAISGAKQDMLHIVLANNEIKKVLAGVAPLEKI